MDSPQDDVNEISSDESSLPDIDNNEDDDDPIKNDEDDQNFDEQLNREIEQGNVVVIEPEEPLLLGADEEKDSDDSGVGDSDALDTEAKSSKSSFVISSPTLSVGRGRYKNPPVNQFNQPLPPLVFREVPAEEGYYSTARKTALPAAYYRKREDPEVQKERHAFRVSSPLIDFKAEFSQISFIVDQDDSNEKGYQHACRRLQEILPDIKIDALKPQHDIWNFGLYLYQIELKKSVTSNLLELIPQEINNEEKRPFWFMFKRPPTFNGIKLREKILKEPNAPRGTSILINHAIYADLSYGALTSMNRFCAHKNHIYHKRTGWSLYFHKEFFEIQTVVSQGFNNDPNRVLTQVKYKIPLDIVDRAAIIHLWNDGFSLFLNMKGNIHELHREWKVRKEGEENLELFIRQGIRDYDKPMPLFSTIRICLRLKDDQTINDLLDPEGKITSSKGKDRLLQTTREESLQQIRELFKNFLEFLYKNRVHVCFGPIYQRLAPLEQLSTLNCQTFPTFIQSYS